MFSKQANKEKTNKITAIVQSPISLDELKIGYLNF